MAVNDVLIIPEIQEVLKRDVSEEKPKLAALSMYNYTSSPNASIYEKVANSEPQDTGRKMQLEKHDTDRCHQLHSQLYDCVTCYQLPPPNSNNSTKANVLSPSCMIPL